MVEDVANRGLVVGVDGSAAALAALRWSAAKARLLHTRVLVIHAWLPSSSLRAPYAPARERLTPEQERARAEATLEGNVAELLRADPDVDVTMLLHEGPAAPVLLNHAREALLLALGRKPRTDVTQPALGAVARACMRLAACPVVTVPEPPPDAAEAELPWVRDGVAAGLERA
ncbi:universal stress protein [Streptomyces sp. AN091965]|uniref:universal stress protein n=1 Tax=Streptomyces sp. AN091965 TaxID=2927803 RepID=UPI001F6198B3|nr:universal stress protein [Streptomyces sp. AN091965]MCI3928869.1 universal stress protein [Streptomyces sp. AN091965]